VEWSGQWENQMCQKNTISDIAYRRSYHILILYFTYKSMKEALITMITVPFALIGGFYGLFYGINLSVAVAVGFRIFGMAIETAMIMTIYLNEAMNKMVEKHGNSSKTITTDILRQYIIDGSAKRLRPKLMTVSVSLFSTHSLVHRDGADVMIPLLFRLLEEQSPLLYMYY
jgi:Cu(I)/Ag(I) efflux system membrane protein CusA/SilA